jgi:hypothetical protein
MVSDQHHAFYRGLHHFPTAGPIVSGGSVHLSAALAPQGFHASSGGFEGHGVLASPNLSYSKQGVLFRPAGLKGISKHEIWS